MLQKYFFSFFFFFLKFIYLFILLGVVGIYGMTDLTDFQTKLFQTKYDSKSYTRSWQSYSFGITINTVTSAKCHPFGVKGIAYSLTWFVIIIVMSQHHPAQKNPTQSSSLAQNPHTPCALPKTLAYLAPRTPCTSPKTLPHLAPCPKPSHTLRLAQKTPTQSSSLPQNPHTPCASPQKNLIPSSSLT